MRRLALLLLIAACADTGPEAKRDGPPTAYAVNYPLQYFAERIAGDLVQVRFVAPDGDPAFWRPDDAEIARCQAADLILLNGAGYAGWAEQTSLPRARCVDTSAGFRDRYIEGEPAGNHTHGPGAEHEHRGVAFTTWLDLGQAALQARAIRDAFQRRWPEHAEAFGAGYAALDADLAGIVLAARDVPLLASHPVYQYWARRFDLNVRSVHFEPDEMPDPAAWQELQAIVKDHPAKWMIWEGEPLPATRAKLKSIGIECVVLDPCGNRPESGDFLTVMRANATNLARTIGR